MKAGMMDAGACGKRTGKPQDINIAFDLRFFKTMLEKNIARVYCNGIK